MSNWWDTGNDLALVQLLRSTAREEGQQDTLNSCLVGTARRLGISEEKIREAFGSDCGLTIYEP